MLKPTQFQRSLTLVISQGQSRNPEKRELEKRLAEQAASELGLQVVVVPHLYDLAPGSKSFESLAALPGDFVICSWLYRRATHWILDRNQVRGQFGDVELVGDDDEDDEEAIQGEEEHETVTSIYARPNRQIYCIDFRSSSNVDEYLEELRRIVRVREEEAQARFDQPVNSTALTMDASGKLVLGESSVSDQSPVLTIDDHPGRRWYPVIDFSRCTNCMECIDFCLFGVYGVDGADTILVEQPDNCRKGCPACSRVCPHNAIIFPQHKTPAIAGAEIDTGGLKIDLSKLFGAPDRDESAADAAARERDEQLILAGRAPVADSDASNAPITEASPKTNQPKDQFDNLLDELDSLDL